MYRPTGNFNIPMKILVPKWENVLGTDKKVYPRQEDVSADMIFYGSFRTFGGTERVTNGLYSVEDTAVIETWFRPDILADCGIVLLNNGCIYEIIGTPENIEMRNQFLKFKVKRLGGKA